MRDFSSKKLLVESYFCPVYNSIYLTQFYLYYRGNKLCAIYAYLNIVFGLHQIEKFID